MKFPLTKYIVSCNKHVRRLMAKYGYFLDKQNSADYQASNSTNTCQERVSVWQSSAEIFNSSPAPTLTTWPDCEVTRICSSVKEVPVTAQLSASFDYPSGNWARTNRKLALSTCGSDGGVAGRRSAPNRATSFGAFIELLYDDRCKWQTVALVCRFRWGSCQLSLFHSIGYRYFVVELFVPGKELIWKVKQTVGEDN